jgi:L-ribulose-5-phosphate 3-epimerase
MRMKRLQLGIVLETTGQPIRSALASIAQLGKFRVSGVQVDAVGELNPEQLTQTGRRELKTLFRTFDLEIAALNCPLRRGLDNTDQLQPRLEHLQKVMQLAVDLGPRLVTMPLPKLADPTSPSATTLRESLLNLGAFADRIGVQIALEVGLDPADKVLEYLQSYDLGCFGICFDPVNFLLNGFDPISSLTTLSRRISYAQARDAKTATVSGLGKEVAVGSGSIDWMLLFATLSSLEYSGYVVVDREDGTSRFADASQGAKFLSRFLAPLDS